MQTILFLVPYPAEKVPAQRFRFEQYLDHLKAAGFKVTIRPFLSNQVYSILYERGYKVQKVAGILMGFLRRFKDLFSAYRSDFVFIHREAAPLGPPIFEWIIAVVFQKKVIYDFDDAIWLKERKEESFLLAAMKWRSKVKFICRKSFRVSCGNAYLVDFTKQVNSRTVLVPTTIDAGIYVAGNSPVSDTTIIGWSGSHSTIQHFEFIVPVLLALKKKYGGKISFMVIGDANYRNDELEIQGLTWRLNTELSDLQKIHIGIMPLPDDKWTRGKCGLKGLQYMSLEIPSVISPIGVNREIIQDGVNGFLAAGSEEWISKISLLVESEQLRKQIGREGRKTVQLKYSTESQKELFIGLFSPDLWD